MSGSDRHYYLRLRREYEPKKHPASDRRRVTSGLRQILLRSTGSTKEPLFAAIMLQFGLSPTTKEIGLHELQERRWSCLIRLANQPLR